MQGWTPIIATSKWGHHGIVEQLLGCQPRADLNIHAEKRTALHWASYYGHSEIVDLLLRNGAKKDMPDQDECTALHLACQQGYKDVVQKLLDHRALIDVPDNKSWAALHKASFHNDTSVDSLDYEYIVMPASYGNLRSDHKQVVGLLLTTGADSMKQTNEGDTPLYLAARQSNTKCLQSLLSGMNADHLATKNNAGQTPLDLALSTETRNAAAIRSLLRNIKIADLSIKSLEREVLLWAAENRDTHDIVALLALKGNCLPKKGVPPEHSESALCWAAYNADLILARRLLYSSPNVYKERKLAEKAVLALLSKEKKQDGQHGGDPDPKATATKGTDRRAKKEHSDKPRKDQGKSTGIYKEILDLLHNPPIVKTTVPPAPCKMPVPGPSTAIDAFEAAVVDFYANDYFSGFLRRLRGVKEVIYDSEQGPNALMTAARETIQKEQSAIEGDRSDSGPSNVFSSDDFQFRWIHLPANSMRWKNDLLSRIYVETPTEDRDRAYGDSEKISRTTWHQVPDTSSQFRFMKPGCLIGSSNILFRIQTNSVAEAG